MNEEEATIDDHDKTVVKVFLLRESRRERVARPSSAHVFVMSLRVIAIPVAAMAPSSRGRRGQGAAGEWICPLASSQKKAGLRCKALWEPQIGWTFYT